jgi:SAM-dependent methyltransferase
MAVKPFGDYAECYAKLYQDKDYAAEVRFVSRILRKFGARTSSLLELGCGTGSYTRLFARTYDRIVAVDISAPMLKQAKILGGEVRTRSSASVSYKQGDLRTLDLTEKFDTVLSLFHVMSYQVENRDLLMAFTSVNRHLKKDGLFLFDFWHGPGVLSCLPERRIKRVESEELEIVRTAVPQIDVSRNSVLVNYDIKLRRKNTAKARSFQEKHRMRYFFLPELNELCARTGFEILETGAWLTGAKPGLRHWYAYLVARVVK